MLSYYVSLRSEFHVAVSVTISTLTRCSVCLYLQLFVKGIMPYLRYLCLLAHSGVQHIFVCLFFKFFCVLLPISLDCPFLVASSVFSNIYIIHGRHC